jgi:S-(hydroxymethyl)glutathione dehydrogenase/alcohol dehydrogenase
LRGATLEAAGAGLVVRGDIELTRAPGPGEVQVRVRATGLCRSDHAAMHGDVWFKTPAMLGHEAAGEVVALGPGVDELQVGDHVVIAVFYSCQRCRACRSGRSSVCANVGDRYRPQANHTAGGTTYHAFCGVGSFTEEIIVSATSAVPIPADVPFDVASLIGCGVVTGLGAVVNGARVTPGSSVAVFGCGGIGMSAIQGARIVGASEIVAVDVSEEKLCLALELGATHAVLPDDLDSLGLQVHGGEGFDYAFEAIGNPQTMAAAYRSVRRGGTVVVLGLAPQGVTLDLDASQLVLDAKTVMGSFYGSGNASIDFPRILRWWRSGQLDLERMISRRVGIEDIGLGMEDLASGDGMRTVVLFE